MGFSAFQRNWQCRLCWKGTTHPSALKTLHPTLLILCLRVPDIPNSQQLPVTLKLLVLTFKTAKSIEMPPKYQAPSWKNLDPSSKLPSPFLPLIC